MNGPAAKDGVWFIYDGECPICDKAAHALRIKRKCGALHLLNAREAGNDALVREVTTRGYDLDEGMVIYHDGRFYHGRDALKFMAAQGAAQNAFTVACKALFWSDGLSRLAYPWMRETRNRLLRRRGIGRIDNLNRKAEPVFRPIFGAAWDDLPPVIKKHYANRPYTGDETLAEGKLDISCAGHIRLLAPVLRLLGSAPPFNEKAVPVSVRFESSPDTMEFCFNRVFHFRGKPPYRFRSRMVQVAGGEVVEIMRFGLCWRMDYLWDGKRVILRHKGYALRIFGLLMPLPLTFVLGRCDAEEWAVDDDTFGMRAAITHFRLGKVYEYTGLFRIL